MRGKPDKFLLFVISCCLVSKLCGQQIEVRGGFLEEEMLLGEKITYWMTASYPPTLEVVLPDSNSNFQPFEFAGKVYFETRLVNGNAFDSVVYFLQSYEIDPYQKLSLSAIILNGADSSYVASPLDSIAFIELVPVVTDTTKLRSDLSYQSVYRQFNYPLLYYLLGAIAILSLVVMLLFGKRIMKALKLRKLRKDYERFSERLTEYIRKLKSEPEPGLAEETLVFWKKYQQKLDGQPFTSYTTRDILSLKFTKELEKPLRTIDRVIYGKRAEDNLYQDFQQIEDFTQYRYSKKVAEIQDEK